MTIAGKRRALGDRSLATNYLLDKLQQSIAGSLAICEPWFGDGSLILSRTSPDFKVRVMNDQERGLVALFEMVRINQQALFELVTRNHDRMTGEANTMLDGKSPFLNSSSDVASGIKAFHTCIKNLGIARAAAIESAASFFNAVHAIHARLEHVLVENLPVDEFIPRFDKSYTVFFIPQREIAALMDTRTFASCITALKGRLLVQCDALTTESFKNAIIASFENRLFLDFELDGENHDFFLDFISRA